MHRLFPLQILKNDHLHSIFIISSCHFILCATKKINNTLTLFYGYIFEKTITLSPPLKPPKKY